MKSETPQMIFSVARKFSFLEFCYVSYFPTLKIEVNCLLKALKGLP